MRTLPLFAAACLVALTTSNAIGWELRTGADQHSGRSYAVVGQRAMNQDAFLALECQPGGVLVGIGTNVPFPTHQVIDDQKAEFRIRTAKSITVTLSPEPTSNGSLNFTTRRNPQSARKIAQYLSTNSGDIVVNVGSAPTLVFEDADRAKKMTDWATVCQLGGMHIRGK